MASFITASEEAVAREARKHGLDVVVCRQIHRPEIRAINNVLYCNDGNWAESLSARVDTEQGKLKTITWHDLQAKRQAEPTPDEGRTREVKLEHREGFQKQNS